MPRPKGSKNKAQVTDQKVKITEQTDVKEETIDLTPKPVKQDFKVSEKKEGAKKIEVLSSPLHVSASVGACFKTGRVGITSLSVQVEYLGEVSEGVDHVAEISMAEWKRLANKGLTQIVPDTYYEGLQKPQKTGGSKSSLSKSVTPPPQSTEPAPAESDMGDEFDVDFDAGVQDVGTVKDAEKALDEIDNAVKENEKFEGEDPVETAAADEFEDDEFADFDDDVSLEATEEEAPNIVEEKVTEELEEFDDGDEFDEQLQEGENFDDEMDEDGEPTLPSDKEELGEKLGINEVVNEDEFDEKADEFGDDKDDPANLIDDDEIYAWDLEKPALIEELTKRNITAIDGTPLVDVPEPELIIALNESLEGAKE